MQRTQKRFNFLKTGYFIINRDLRVIN